MNKAVATGTIVGFIFVLESETGSERKLFQTAEDAKAFLRQHYELNWQGQEVPGITFYSLIAVPSDDGVEVMEDEGYNPKSLGQSRYFYPCWSCGNGVWSPFEPHGGTVECAVCSGRIEDPEYDQECSSEYYEY